MLSVSRDMGSLLDWGGNYDTLVEGPKRRSERRYWSLGTEMSGIGPCSWWERAFFVASRRVPA